MRVSRTPTSAATPMMSTIILTDECLMFMSICLSFCFCVERLPVEVVVGFVRHQPPGVEGRGPAVCGWRLKSAHRVDALDVRRPRQLVAARGTRLRAGHVEQQP